MKRYMGRGPLQRSFCPQGVWSLARWHVEASWFPTWKLPEKGPKRAFMKVLFHSRDWLSHWPTAMGPSLLPGNQRLRLNSPALSSHGWCFWQPVPCPYVGNWGQETKYYPIALNLSSGNSKGFGSHEPGPVGEDETHMTNISEFGHLNDQIYVFWINPSIAVCLRHLPGVESPHMPFWWAHLFFFSSTL